MFGYEAIWSWTFIVGRVLLHIQFHFQWWVCLNYLFLLDSVLLGCMSLDSFTFLLGCQICWHVCVHSIHLLFFVFLQYPLRFPFFYFLFCLFSFLSLLFCESGQRFLNFAYPFKALGFIDFIFFLNLYFIAFLSDIY